MLTCWRKPTPMQLNSQEARLSLESQVCTEGKQSHCHCYSKLTHNTITKSMANTYVYVVCTEVHNPINAAECKCLNNKRITMVSPFFLWTVSAVNHLQPNLDVGQLFFQHFIHVLHNKSLCSVLSIFYVNLLQEVFSIILAFDSYYPECMYSKNG